MKIGVLAIQGDYGTHAKALEEIGFETVEIRRPSDAGFRNPAEGEAPDTELGLLEGLKEPLIEGIVLPGGESSTFDLLGRRYGVDRMLKELAKLGKTIFGTCAGAIWLGKGTHHKVTSLGIIDAEISRNAYGRQVDSFITDIPVKGLDKPFESIFIRAPKINNIGPDVEIVAEYNNDPVFVRQGNVWICTFHPERSADRRMHKLIFGA